MLDDRFESVSIKRLVARNFFQKWNTVTGSPGTAPVKLGIIGSDNADGHRKVEREQPDLAQYGINPVVVFCPVPVDQVVPCQNNTVLKFRSMGVTHVFGANIFFPSTADGQKYYPRYFIHYGPRTYAANNAAASLRGSMSESYVPSNDVEQAQDPGGNKAATECLQLMKKSGQDTTDRSTQWSMELTCDLLFFLQAAIQKNPVLTTDGLRKGFEELGSYPSAITFESRFGSGEQASAVAVRDVSFNMGCKCYVYDSKINYS